MGLAVSAIRTTEILRMIESYKDQEVRPLIAQINRLQDQVKSLQQLARTSQSTLDLYREERKKSRKVHFAN